MRIAPSGSVMGLDYNAINVVFDLNDIPKEDRKDIFNQVLNCFQIERERNE